jgi:4-amino-4-deoxy-L-arabinose transferase-like glycosyltransferase
MSRAVNLRPNAPLLFFVVLLAAALPYFINLGQSALWDSNETFYAETPREMLETHGYLAPMFNYAPRTQKPPLTYWLVVLGYRTVGIGELGVRLPAAFAAVGTLLFTYGIAHLLFSSRAGLLALAILGTTLRLFVLARKLPIDVLLLFWLTAVFYFLIRAQRNGSRLNWILAYVCAGLGFLTKGPVALAIPGLSYLVWSLWTRRFKLSATCPVMGILALAAVVMPWYVLIYQRYRWLYIRDFFVQDNFARFATQTFGGWSIGPLRGPFYYIPVFLADFFPWSLLTVAAGIYLWSERKSLRAHNALTYGFPLAWAAVTFLFFTISKNKQEYYIAPIYPAMAVALAGIMDRSLFPDGMLSEHLRRYWRVMILVTALTFLPSAILLPFALRALIPRGPAVLHYAPSVLLFLAAVVLMRYAFQGRLIRSVFSIACFVWLSFLMAGAIYLPALEQLRPVKEICRDIQAQAQPDDEVGYYRAAVPSMLFYLRRPIFMASDPDIMMRKFQGAARVFCVVSEQDYSFFGAKRDLNLTVLGRYPQLPTQLKTMLRAVSPVGENLLLVSNRPSLEAGSRGSRENS